MNDDIVARLRVLNHHAKKLAENESLHDLYRDAFTRCENLTWEAADEIERLRSVVEAWKTYSSRAERDIETLRAERDGYLHGNRQTLAALAEANEIAKNYKAERDEARRDRCMARAVIRWDLEHPNSPDRSHTTITLLAWQIADEEGWDCFEGMKR
jgi:hypothetical protein